MTEKLAHLIGIATKKAKKEEMQTFDSAFVSLNQGVNSDFRGKRGKRQVTVLSQLAWSQACTELNQPLNWMVRRANLLVDNLDLFESKGKILKIGKVKLLITGETDPCSRMNDAYSGLFDALRSHWRGGVCCEVIAEGEIRLNDEVSYIE